jgi:hypothetical protein
MNPQETSYDISKSNFFPDTSKTAVTSPQIQNINPIPQIEQNQAFPPIQTQIDPTQQSQVIYSNTLQQNSQSKSQTQTFLEKVNSTATGVFDYIKSKAPPIPTNIITKNLLDNVDPLTIISEIKNENFAKVLEKSLKEINCFKLDKSKLNDMTILVKVSNPRQINNSIFSQSYVLYDVSTPQLNWLVNRRYSDFIWLRDCLHSLFPCDILPLLPKKKLGNRRFEQDFLNKRTEGLQKFLNEIVNNEKYKATEVLTIFLSYIDRTMFEQKMKTITPKLLNRENVQNIQNFEGKNKIINIEFGNEAEVYSYFSSISMFLVGQSELLDNLKKNLSDYKKCMTEASRLLEEVEKNFSKLTMMLTKVNISEKMNNIYENYEIFFKNWKRVQVNQCCIIKDMVKNFFKDVKNKSDVLIDNLEQTQNIQEEYLSQKNKLLAKKELLWKQMDISKWELNQGEPIDSNRLFHDKLYAQEKMCFKETIELNNKGELLGYYFYQNYLNFKDFIDELNKSYVSNISDFSNQLYPSLTDGINVWSDLETHIKKN